MATNALPGQLRSASRLDTSGSSLAGTAEALLRPLASLRLTVVLLAMAIFIVFAGTMAQWEKDIWQVVDDYFRTPLAWIDFQIFFPPSFFSSQPQVGGGFYFPGGWLIGTLMGVNLVAAHGIRFKPQVRGMRLVTGLLAIALGIVLTWVVVASGNNKHGVLEEPLVSWPVLWTLSKVMLAVLWVASMWSAVRLWRARNLEFWLWTVASGIVGALVVWLVFQGDAARLNDSGMRILWQLIKGTTAGLVLLAGCAMVFKKRAGVVLLHGGIGLMMFSELLVGTTAVESQMTLEEGQATNYSQDIRTLELAVVDHTSADRDEQVVVPQSMLLGQPRVSDVRLPFDVELVRFYKNATLRDVAKDDKSNPATAGLGLQFMPEEARAAVGTDSSGKVDMAAAYVKLLDKKTHEPLGTYLVTPLAALQDIPEQVAVGGKTYDVALRFRRYYKPYSVSLVDVRKDDYLGTSTPRNYSSDIRLVDAGKHVDRNIHIWMNNPLRFAGETFYQQGYNFDPQRNTETTTLQIVGNSGWMIPYVGCMIVAVGMLAHFGVTLSRFLGRREDERARAAALASAPVSNTEKKRRARVESAGTRTGAVGAWFPIGVGLAGALFFAYEARVPRVQPDQADLYAFGKLPVVYEGRVKPLDTLARNTLRAMSDYQTFRDAGGKRQPAIRWLLDVMVGAEEAETAPVLKIDNPEILDTLGLERRPKHLYSVRELSPKAVEFERQVKLAREEERQKKPLSVYQQKMLELDARVRAFTLVHAAFNAPAFPAFPTEEEFNRDKQAVAERAARIRAMLDAAVTQSRELEKFMAPRLVPVDGGESTWQTYPAAVIEAYLGAMQHKPTNPNTTSLVKISDAYARGDAAGFNEAVAAYRGHLEARAPHDYNAAKVGFEAYFNHFEPFFWSAFVYLLAFVLAALAWLGWSRPLNRAALALILVTLVVHTFALVARMYISGRPPVTNLYSSAVFIGWAAVVLGVVLELVYKLGIGNMIAGIAGFSTLLIAHFLAASGDTLVVLQAVLDTQFWLATHVVCITLGYATTYMAGMLALLYLVLGVFTTRLSPATAKELTRMTYGTLCFAIFFSFVGTVLGGLWADDSWGRFWGWDPKENGALMIVLWNALVLHARWGGMVKDRGLALLAIAGNIAVSWSWFGVNELGVGLHSYGFTKGVREALAWFVVSQLVLIAIGLIPQHRWLSWRKFAPQG